MTVLRWVLVVAVGVAFAWLLSTNLADVPGLQGDEAWFGLRAHDILRGENDSIHGLNGYTGALFPFLVSLVFRACGESVSALSKLPGRLTPTRSSATTRSPRT